MTETELYRDRMEREARGEGVKSLEVATRPAAVSPTPARRNTRPKLSLATVEDYLDWVLGNVAGMHAAHVDAHLRGAELVIRTAANAAQGKATQHTLVQDGTIDQPGQ